METIIKVERSRKMKLNFIKLTKGLDYSLLHKNKIKSITLLCEKVNNTLEIYKLPNNYLMWHNRFPTQIDTL